MWAWRRSDEAPPSSIVRRLSDIGVDQSHRLWMRWRMRIGRAMGDVHLNGCVDGIGRDTEWRRSVTWTQESLQCVDSAIADFNHIRMYLID